MFCFFVLQNGALMGVVNGGQKVGSESQNFKVRQAHIRTKFFEVPPPRKLQEKNMELPTTSLQSPQQKKIEVILHY